MVEARVPLILVIDVEPDLDTFPIDEPSPWHGFELFIEESARLRDTLETATGEAVRFCWVVRMDPQIEQAYGTPGWAVDRYGGFLHGVRALGDAVGVHPHAWRWDAAEEIWLADHANRGFLSECLQMSFDTYQAAFGEVPPYHRFGFRFMSTEIMNRVRELGGRFDLTLEPGEPARGPGLRMGRLWTGVVPDYAGLPRVPYHPDPTDFSRPRTDGSDPLWVIPLSSGRYVPPPAAGATTANPGASLARRLRHPTRTAGRLVRKLQGDRPGGPKARPSYRPLAMTREWRSPADFWDACFEAVEEQGARYLSLGLRTDILARPDRRHRFDGVMDHLLGDPRARGLVFTTPDEAIRRLELTVEVGG